VEASSVSEFETDVAVTRNSFSRTRQKAHGDRLFRDRQAGMPPVKTSNESNSALF
jgi:hypothetical protein